MALGILEYRILSFSERSTQKLGKQWQKRCGKRKRLSNASYQHEKVSKRRFTRTQHLRICKNVQMAVCEKEYRILEHLGIWNTAFQEPWNTEYWGPSIPCSGAKNGDPFRPGRPVGSTGVYGSLYGLTFDRRDQRRARVSTGARGHVPAGLARMARLLWELHVRPTLGAPTPVAPPQVCRRKVEKGPQKVRRRKQPKCRRIARIAGFVSALRPLISGLPETRG